MRYRVGVSSMVWLKRFAAVVAGVLAVGKPASAQQQLPAGWLESQLNERAQKCVSHEIHGVQGGVLVACGMSGVWEIALGDAGPRFVRSHEVAGEAIGFITEPDGALWVKLRLIEARPFASASSAAAVRFPEAVSTTPAPIPPAAVLPPAPVPPESVAAPRRPGVAATRSRIGRVVKVAPGHVVISLGALDDLARGDRIELSSELVESEPGDAAAEDVASMGEPLAVGVVTNVSSRSAKVQVGLNESVPLGATAFRSRASSTASSIAPPRVGDIWDARLMARPFAAIGELGGGFLLSGSIARRFESNFQLRAVIDPVAYADVESSDGVTAWNIALMASYDSEFFEMGAGFGGQTVNEPDFFLQPGSGLSAAQLIRLGAEDGLNLKARTSVVLFHSEFAFGDMTAALQIPIGRGYWLLFGGGGGNVGYGYGELGLRVLLSGNGLAGSKFLNVSAGGAGVFRSPICEDAFFECQQSQVAFGGPMAGIGGEWRF
jgi:hypothetical protein